MRAFLIDPAARTVEQLDNHQGWPHQAISDAIQTLRISGAPLYPEQRLGDRVWVDDEGFLEAGRPVFFLGEYAMPLAGRGLVLGLNQAGENRVPSISIEDLRKEVYFTNLETTATPRNTPTGIHMGLPICRPARDWVPSTPASASFAFALVGPIAKLEDVGDHRLVPTVTNDAEAVFAVLREAIGPRMAHTPVIYRDSDQVWDAMLPNDEGGFRGFLPLQCTTFEAAADRLNAMFGG